MPPAVAAAGISAAGSIGGAIAGGKSAKKVAKIQQKTAEEQMAQTKQFYDDSVARYQPDITQGNAASSLYAGLLGDGGDAASSAAALQQWKNSTDYQNTLNEALNGVNASAYAAGMGRSGAAMKALQDRAATVADGTLQQYLGNLNTQVQTGANAKAALTGAATTAVTSNNATAQNAANAASNAALSTGNTTASLLGNLGNLAATAYQSSYGGTSGAPIYNGQDWSSWVKGN